MLRLNWALPEAVNEAFSGVPIIDGPASRAELHAEASAELYDVGVAARRARSVFSSRFATPPLSVHRAPTLA